MLERNAQQYYLNAIGLPHWVLRENEEQSKLANSLVPSGLLDLDFEERCEPECEQGRERGRSQIDSTANKNTEQFDSAPLIPAPVPEGKQDELLSSKPEISLVSTETNKNNNLTKQISVCKLCEQRLYGKQSLKLQLLHQSHITPKSILLLVDMPSISEYQQGKYLLEQYKNLINAIFHAVNLDVNVYISAQLKCLASQYHFSTKEELLKDEINNCLPFLKSEIAQIQPNLIVSLGSVYLDRIVQDENIGEGFEMSVGKKYTIKQTLSGDRSIPIFCTYHPSFLFRHTIFKSKALQDWIKISNLLEK